MAEFSQLMGDVGEIDKFLEENELPEQAAPEKRPLWPEVYTMCPVIGCQAGYGKFCLFQRHLEQVPLEFKKAYTCPCCSRKFFRKDRATHHIRIKHKMVASLQEILEKNEHFVHPGEKLPFRVNHRLRLENKPRREETPGNTLVTEAADCRDEIVTFDVDGNYTGKVFKRSRDSLN